MKLLPLFILISSVAFSQKLLMPSPPDTSGLGQHSKPWLKPIKIETIKVNRDCAAGYSWMPSLSTSSLRLVADTCLPDSVCERLWEQFGKNACGEGGMLVSTFPPVEGSLLYHRSPKWDSVKKECIVTTKYSIYKSDKWVDISACEYYQKSHTTCGTIGENANYIPTPCCGHKHPPNDWKTIIVDK